MTRPLAVVSCALLLTSICAAADAPEKIWEVSLRDRLVANNEPPADDLQAVSLAFSPDGSRLAALFGNLLGATRYLLVAPVDHPETTLFWTRLTRPVASPLPADVWWASDGNSLIANNTLIRLPGGQRCRADQSAAQNRFVGFLNAKQALISLQNGRRGEETTTIAAIDFSCSIARKWADLRFVVRGISPDGAKVAAQGFASGRSYPEFFLSELESKQKMKLTSDGRLSANAVFVNDGKLVCASTFKPNRSRSDAPFDARISCWDTQTRKRVRQSTEVWRGGVRGLPLMLSAGGGRIASTDGWGRAVWEIETDRIIASWARENADPRALDRARCYDVAISPDGKLVADGGHGTLRLFRLP